MYIVLFIKDRIWKAYEKKNDGSGFYVDVIT